MPDLDDIWAGRWPESTVINDFRQKEPGDGTPATLQTTAYLSYDDRNLYVIFECIDDPDQVRARMAKRENIGDDDQLFVYLDTFLDRRRAYVFSVNPLGVQNDGVLTEGQGTDENFDAVWRSEARRTASGFRVFMAIPFSSLRFSNADIQTWGIALGRYSARNSELSYWPYVTSRVSGFVNQMAILHGLQHVSPSRNMQAIPYGAFTSARYLDPGASSYIQAREGRVGLDSKFAIRDAFTLDVTLNPDFSQVETDDPQVTVNQRYEVFFPEKRPFFSENAALFATKENLLFTRRIVDPRFGGRFTGKAGRWALGALVTDDRAAGASDARRGAVAGGRAVATAVRVQRELGRESSIGVFVTDRRFGASRNSVASVDTRLKLNSNWTATAQAIRNADAGPDGRETGGSAFHATLDSTGRHLTFSSSYLQRSPDFAASLGFVRRVDVRQGDHYLGYYWRPNKGALLAFGPSISVGTASDYRWKLEDWYVTPRFEVFFRRQYGLTFRRSESSETFAGTVFRENDNRISAYSSRSQRVSFSAEIAVGRSPNYSPPQGVAPVLARSMTGSTGVTFRPNTRLRIDDTYYYTRLTTLSGNPPVALANSRIFTNHINRTKANFQFTRALSARAIVDYYGLVPQPLLIGQPLTKKLTGDLLLTYQLNPFTALYVGYSEIYANLDLAAGSNGQPALRVTESASTLGSRQLFIKMSYRFGL